MCDIRFGLVFMIGCRRSANLLLCGAFVALSGCGRPVASATARIGATSPVAFTLRVEPDGSDPALVSVLVEASPNIWQDYGWDDAATRQALALYVEPRAPQQPGIIGDYGMEGAELWFRPRFPLLPGQAYRAEFRYAQAGGEPIHLDYTYVVPPADASLPARIEAIYPSTSELPANHLKFYVLFSEPMQQSEAWKYFTLVDETTGKPVPEPFRHTELWSEDGRRLTLWLHPGRQKTGVNLNVEIGAVLDKDRHYTLRISSDWHSRRGATLERPVQKMFAVVAADRTRPDLNTWEFHLPRAGTRDPIRLTFPEPLDWALLQSQLWVEAEAGRKLSGRIVPGPEEKSWAFTPTEPWAAGDYRLGTGSVLEDLAGNSLGRPFEVDLQADASAAVPAIIYRTFHIPTTASASDRGR